MIIIQAYKDQGYELTQAQKDALFQKARVLKAFGYSHMLVVETKPAFSSQSLLEYVAVCTGYTIRAFVGPRGGLSNGTGAASKRGESFKKGNALEKTIEDLSKFKHVLQF